MKIKTTKWVWCSALPLLFLIRFAHNNPNAIENYYSRLFYPQVFELRQFFLNFIPFSIGDVLYIGFILYGLKIVLKRISFWKAKPIQLFFDFGSFVIITAWIFHLSWGFNYHRIPLNEQLAITISYSKQDLEERLDKLIQQSNHWHGQLVTSDTVAVEFPLTKDQTQEKVSLYSPFYHETLLNVARVKKSLLSLPLSYMGYSGYLNPFTLESQVNTKMPLMSQITTSFHEAAHQLGYASEKEANFIAYISAIKNNDPYIKFAGYTFASKYLYYELYKIDTEAARAKLKLLNPGILKNFREVSDFWKKYENPFEVIFDKTYDEYLKANGQKSGIKSYHEMVGLVINYHKNDD